MSVFNLISVYRILLAGLCWFFRKKHEDCSLLLAPADIFTVCFVVLRVSFSAI